jgi:hypothetical protein
MTSIRVVFLSFLLCYVFLHIKCLQRLTSKLFLLHLFSTHILLASKASFSQAKRTSGHTNHINGNHNKKLVANVSIMGWWRCGHVA